MKYSRILGTGSFLPPNIVTNAMLADKVQTSDEWIVARSGIEERRIAADGSLTSDLALYAAREAISVAHLTPEEIDLIIVATTTPDMLFPSTACLVQEKLGIQGCPAFDVQAVCAGFIYALITADLYIKGGMAKKALVIGADIMSRLIDWNDRRTCVLFADGAGAVVLGASEEPGIMQAKLAADGRHAALLNVPANVANGQCHGLPFLQMDGRAIFKMAVKLLADVARLTLEQAGLTPDKLDWLVPHQANIRIIEATAKHLGLPLDKVILTLSKHGNTSAASIPLALDSAVCSGQIQRNHTVLLEAIGGGLVWGAVLLVF